MKNSIQAQPVILCGGSGTRLWPLSRAGFPKQFLCLMKLYRGVATKYLANYLEWRRLLDRFKDNVTPEQFLFHALRTSYQ